MDALSAVSVAESELQKRLVREYLQGVAKGLSVEEGLVGFISIQFSICTNLLQLFKFKLFVSSYLK